MDKTRQLELVTNLANELSLDRVKTEGFNYSRDYRRDKETGDITLVGEKVVVRTQGKTVRVAFGAGTLYETEEEAVEATKTYWSEYFRAYRAKQRDNPNFKAGVRRRAKSYRDRQRAHKKAVSRRA